MRFNDTTIGAIFLVLGLALAWYSFELPAIPGQNYGAATFPFLISVELIGCSTRLLYSSIRNGSEPWLFLADDIKNMRALAGVAATLVLIVFYIFFADVLGFIPTAIIITYAMLLILKVPVAKAALIAIIAAFVCDFIFRTMLLVPLPFGMVPRLPW